MRRRGDQMAERHLDRKRKIAGILAEAKGDSVVLGMGIDVNDEDGSFPAELRDTAASLRIVTGSIFDRGELLAGILRNLERYYVIWERDGFGADELRDGEADALERNAGAAGYQREDRGGSPRGNKLGRVSAAGNGWDGECILLGRPFPETVRKRRRTQREGWSLMKKVLTIDRGNNSVKGALFESGRITTAGTVKGSAEEIAAWAAESDPEGAAVSSVVGEWSDSLRGGPRRRRNRQDTPRRA